jgi:hypothetical protein
MTDPRTHPLLKNAFLPTGVTRSAPFIDRLVLLLGDQPALFIGADHADPTFTLFAITDTRVAVVRLTLQPDVTVPIEATVEGQEARTFPLATLRELRAGSPQDEASSWEAAFEPFAGEITALPIRVGLGTSESHVQAAIAHLMTVLGSNTPVNS